MKFFKIQNYKRCCQRSASKHKKRVEKWIKTNIHIKGKPAWIFIKTSMHGAVADQVVLGSEMNNLFTWLEIDFNDGKNYILHYVTAREAFNIFKAVEADEPGENPEK